jgi:hypothetical protein
MTTVNPARFFWTVGPVLPIEDGARMDLDAADLRILRGSVPAKTQLAEALKAQIVQQRLPRGGPGCAGGDGLLGGSLGLIDGREHGHGDRAGQ